MFSNMANASQHVARVRHPAIRRGWLEKGPGGTASRGSEEFVRVEWPEAIKLVAGELSRIIETHGNRAIFGGSYGWASAGRFHHAQSQLHRFLNVLGGYTASANSYSAAALEVVAPYILGSQFQPLAETEPWGAIIDEAELVVAFGGLHVKNVLVNPGGMGSHRSAMSILDELPDACEIVSISPMQDSLSLVGKSRWIPLRPGTDTAVMMAILQHLVDSDRVDWGVIDTFTVGFDRLWTYLAGDVDGIRKDPSWAAELSGVPRSTIIELAESMATKATFISVSLALQRARYGEQPIWMSVALGAALGEIGLAGRGVGLGQASMGYGGQSPLAVGLPTLPQGTNAVGERIPVARIADMLLNPGGRYDFDGETHVYPEARLVYWAGGNPFHHHQDLGRLSRAFARPETIIVHEPYWTSTAKRADIVLPTTISLERSDIGAGKKDPLLIAMEQIVLSPGEAVDDFTILSLLSEELGTVSTFTEDRTSQEWLVHLYDDWRMRCLEDGHEFPLFDEFWRLKSLELPVDDAWLPSLRRFRSDPDRHPLGTPSGKIEIYSERIAGYEYEDCGPHPTWYVSEETVLRRDDESGALILIADQPSHRLHSQLDFGRSSQATKVGGRERMRINPDDATERSIDDGDVVRVWNERGAFLAGAAIDRAISRGCVQVSTGAWFDEITMAGMTTCVHGNPNVVTPDIGTSRLAQGCSGQHARILVERYSGELPTPTPYSPPPMAALHVSSIDGDAD